MRSSGSFGQLLVGVLELVGGEEEAAEGLGSHLIGLGSQVLALAQVAVDGGVDPAVDHVADELAHVFAIQHLAALLVDDLTLDVHHVVVLQGVLSGLEVLGLHLLLGVLDGAGEDLGVDGGVVVHAQGLHHVHDPLGAEQAHDVVLQGQVEAALAGVALTAGTAAQLVVDAAGLVALGAQDEQAAGLADLIGLGASSPYTWPRPRRTSSGRPGSPGCRSRRSRWPRRSARRTGPPCAGRPLPGTRRCRPA